MNVRLSFAAIAAAGFMALANAAWAEIREPLTPENSTLLYVDLQPQYVFSVHTIDAGVLVNNATGVAKAAKVFNVPTIFTTINTRSFAGPMLERVAAARPDVVPIDRTSINALGDDRVDSAVKSTGRKKVLIGGLWTASCVVLPALTLLKAVYEVYIVTDVAGDVDKEAHDMAIRRMVHTGAVPVTWLAVMLEW